MAKLYFRYGAMNCGKTTNVIQTAYNYKEKGKNILLLKAEIDTKGEDTVINRSGQSMKVDYLIDKKDSIFNLPLENVKAIVVDEAQFLTTNQVDELYYITKMFEIPVICYGIRTDFQMQTFPGSARLLAIADDLEESKTICNCERKATQNMRKVNGIPTFEGDQVAIDGENKVTYESVCGKCYLETREKYQKITYNPTRKRTKI